MPAEVGTWASSGAGPLVRRSIRSSSTSERDSDEALGGAAAPARISIGFARVFSGWGFFDNLAVVALVGHGLGLGHDFRNDLNAHGNMMGNGCRRIRGNLFPDRYPGRVQPLAGPLEGVLQWRVAQRLLHQPVGE